MHHAAHVCLLASTCSTLVSGGVLCNLLGLAACSEGTCSTVVVGNTVFPPFPCALAVFSSQPCVWFTG